MIQSDKFDSLNMNIKKITNITLIFIVKRLAEIFGFLVFFAGLILLVSLIYQLKLKKMNCYMIQHIDM